jgi:hypothetical protein
MSAFALLIIVLELLGLLAFARYAYRRGDFGDGRIVALGAVAAIAVALIAGGLGGVLLGAAVLLLACAAVVLLHPQRAP